MDHVDVLVVGAGVVGLAIGRELAVAGRDVVVADAQRAIGQGTSSRSSEVIHAGLYYASGSLKARLCAHGRELLYAYTQSRGIPHRNCGKLVVACLTHEVSKLADVHQQALTNGVETHFWSGERAAAEQPGLACLAAVHSPSTGIVDTHALMLSLQGDLERAGGVVALHTKVVGLSTRHRGSNQIAVRLEQGDTTLLANTVVNSAGLSAVALARLTHGMPQERLPQAYLCKGNYFSLKGASPFSTLIYPTPETAGLGVHMTLDMGGQARFGPDAEWLGEAPHALAVDPALDYTVPTSLLPAFEASVRRYWPGLPDNALSPAYAGIRPKIVGPNAPAGDFHIEGPEEHGVPGLVNLLGIESPGVTACLAIARCVAQSLGVNTRRI